MNFQNDTSITSSYSDSQATSSYPPSIQLEPYYQPNFMFQSEFNFDQVATAYTPGIGYLSYVDVYPELYSDLISVFSPFSEFYSDLSTDNSCFSKDAYKGWSSLTSYGNEQQKKQLGNGSDPKSGSKVSNLSRPRRLVLHLMNRLKPVRSKITSPNPTERKRRLKVWRNKTNLAAKNYYFRIRRGVRQIKVMNITAIEDWVHLQ